jgi:hypothetical protein
MLLPKLFTGVNEVSHIYKRNVKKNQDISFSIMLWGNMQVIQLLQFVAKSRSHGMTYVSK